MRVLLSLPATLLVAFASCAFTASAQKVSAAERLLKARPTYYTPTANGLNSFSCNVSFDWKTFLEQASGKPVEETDPFLVYVKSVRMSVSDNLRGKGQLLWEVNGLPPDSEKTRVDQMRAGMQQVVGGFFQTWNAFMSGRMLPVPDDSMTVMESGTGLILKAKSSGTDVTETFDKNILLLELHVTSADMDAFIYPTYTDTEDGRVVSTIRAVYHAPPEAPGAEATMGVTYKIVSSFRLPSALILSVKNAGSFPFQFTDCNATI